MRISKSKKIKYAIIILILVIISVIGFWSMKSTASDEVNYKIKIKELRADSDLGYGELRLNGRVERCIKIWNLVKVNDECEDEDNCEELPLYCLQAELGFASDTSTNGEDADSHTITYTKKFDMKLKSDKEKLNNGSYENDKNNDKEEKLIIEKEENNEKYNKVVWLADNMYIPNQDTVEDKIEILKKAGVIQEEKLTNFTTDVRKEILTELKAKESAHHIIDIQEEINSLPEDKINELFYSECFLSDDIMEVVQQLAFWYIIHEEDPSKKDNYHRETLPNLYCTEEESDSTPGTDSYNKTLKQIYTTSISCGERRKCNYF